MIKIEISATPQDYDEHLEALGLMRKPFVAVSRLTAREAVAAAGEAVLQSATTVDTTPVNGGVPISTTIAQAEASADFVAHADDAGVDLGPSPVRTVISPEGVVSAPGYHPSGRKVGQPGGDRRRRSREEVAEDKAYETAHPERRDTLVEAEPEPAGISSGETREDPQDAADEAAESAANKTGPTRDDIRSAVTRYMNAFGAAAASANMRALIGSPIEQVPADEAAILAVIERIDAQIALGEPIGLVQRATEPMTAAEVDERKDEGSLFGGEPEAPPATKEDFVAAISIYRDKLCGGDRALANQDGAKILEQTFTNLKIKALTDIPDFGRAVAALNRAIEENPFKRTPK